MLHALLREIALNDWPSYGVDARATVRGRVALTEMHLQFLEQRPVTVEHFADLMFDTPDLDLIRNGCWLVKRQGIHLHKSLFHL